MRRDERDGRSGETRIKRGSWNAERGTGNLFELLAKRLNR